MSILLTLFTGGAFAAAALYAHYAYEQVGAMRDTVTKTQALLDDQQKATKAARDAADAAVETLHDSQRPWVGLLDFGAKDPLAVAIKGEYQYQPFHADMVFKNFGTSAGMDIHPQMEEAMNYDELDRMADKTCKDAYIVRNSAKAHHFGHALMPNDTFVYPVYFGTGDPRQNPPNAVNPYFIIGCIIYTDQFKLEHRTRFCLQINRGEPDQQLATCNLYNDAN